MPSQDSPSVQPKGTDLRASDSAPDSKALRVVIEGDPNPQYPSPFCNSPMRLRNAEPFLVTARYSETYRAEGPTQHCNVDPRTTLHEVLLGPGDTRYLGCSRYRTTNMLCTEKRSWTLLSAVKAGASSTPDSARVQPDEQTMQSDSTFGFQAVQGNNSKGQWVVQVSGNVTVYTPGSTARLEDRADGFDPTIAIFELVIDEVPGPMKGRSVPVKPIQREVEPGRYRQVSVTARGDNLATVDIVDVKTVV